MRRIDRNSLRAPAFVLDVELAPVTQVDEDALRVEQYETIWCLSRNNGIPQEISFWDVAKDKVVSLKCLRDQLHPRKSLEAPINVDPSQKRPADLDVTVVICTRDRPAGLRATLQSLQRQTDANFDIIVVNNSSNSKSESVIEELSLVRCEYVTEPRTGLSRARNRALSMVHTDAVAWIDDDEIADSDWVRRLKDGFSHQARPAAVCGVMLPAELEFEAQVRFEQYGGFNKGRGLAPEILRMGTPSVVSPLYPLPSFGPGGNMAFRAEPLRAVGGFDSCLGAGTRTHGCEETRVLSLLLSSGHTVLHWPGAITWHTHRREMQALKKQLYGYSAGLSAFYASMIRSNPMAIFDIIRLTPHMIRDFRTNNKNLRSGQLPDDFPPCILKAVRHGLLTGGPLYFYEIIKDRAGRSR
jgi:glycosyltransferase involved in cell wall biosynthesis